MRLVLVIMIFITTVSCGQSNITDVSILNHQKWKESFLKNVKNEKTLSKYDKESLIESSEHISIKDFVQLRQVLLGNSTDREIENEYYLLEMSEGEIVMVYFYYIIELNGRFQVAFIEDVYQGNKEVKKDNNKDSKIKELINIKQIDDETLTDNLIVLTTLNGESISSTIGVYE